MARVLTLNAGSSSLKFALFEGEGRVASGVIERMGMAPSDHEGALARVFEHLKLQGTEPVDGVGHRVVHGGDAFDRATFVDEPVLVELRRLVPLDPDHLPAELALVEAMRARAPSTPQVACFDTAFHRTLLPVARRLPIPRGYDAQGVRRYGFHGLSYQFLVEELARVAGESAANGRVILAHLGSGASLAAVRDGRSVDTTMGFTPNSGVPMGTRSGDLEPGVLLHLLRAGRMTTDALDHLLSRESGLLGVSGSSGDMRDLLAREASDPAAAEAVALFVYQVRKAIGALAAVLDGVDTLVFAGGIGENAPTVRARVCAGLGHLGVRFDEARNTASAAVVSTDESACTVRVLHTDEEVIIARDTRRLLTGQEERHR